MNQAYRSPRYKTQDVIDIVRNRVVVECDVGAALEDLLKLDVIKKHLAGKTPRQMQEFQL
jgi:histone-lysine N-methyltransferase SUV420H